MRFQFLTVAWVPGAALERLPFVIDYWKNRAERQEARLDELGAIRRQSQRDWYAAERAWDEHVQRALDLGTLSEAFADTDDPTLLAYARWCSLAVREHIRRGEKSIADWFAVLRSVLEDEYTYRCEAGTRSSDPDEILRAATAALSDDDLDAIGIGCMYDIQVLWPAYGEGIVDVMLVVNDVIRQEWQRRPFRVDLLSETLDCVWNRADERSIEIHR